MRPNVFHFRIKKCEINVWDFAASYSYQTVFDNLSIYNKRFDLLYLKGQTDWPVKLKSNFLQ